MSDRSDPKRPTDGQPQQPASSNPPKPKGLSEEPGFVDGIPVEELVRMTREFTARITNEDRQRLALEISESGHQRTIQSSSPFLLQQFFTGKVDLDVELSRRYPSPPLLSSAIFTPEPGKAARYGFALFSSQDNSAAISLEIRGSSGAIDISFLLQSMIAVRFSLGAVTQAHRTRFLDLMRRQTGIAFLWTKERWERDYLIFVVREHFARIYAFGPGRFDGACRLTPDILAQLVQWLQVFWDGADLPADDPGDMEESSPDTMNW
jgi:hypothetical protein